jgi:hypothetical protein
MLWFAPALTLGNGLTVIVVGVEVAEQPAPLVTVTE